MRSSQHEVESTSTCKIVDDLHEVESIWGSSQHEHVKLIDKKYEVKST